MYGINTTIRMICEGTATEQVKAVVVQIEEAFSSLEKALTILEDFARTKP